MRTSFSRCPGLLPATAGDRIRALVAGVGVLTILLGLSLALSACDSNSSADDPVGTLAVSVSTSGEMPDPDGYTLTVNETTSEDVDPDGAISFSALPEGNHDVSLSGLQANCSTTGPNPRSVTILRQDTANVAFSVTCQSTSGAIEVHTATSGATPDADGYLVQVDGSDSTQIFPDGRTTFRNLSEGDHEVLLSDLQVNCSVSGDNPQTVTVTPTETTEASFELTCPKALLDAIAFNSDRAGNEDIYAMDADGSNLYQITTDPGVDLNPAVSSDGATIAFQSNRDGNREIYTIRADGSGASRVTDHDSLDATPAWSPDGSRLAFSTYRSGNLAVYTVDPDGSNLTQVTSHDSLNAEPAWSPDGSRLAFSTNRNGNFDIYTMDPDGSNVSQVTSNDAADFAPRWSPDGSQIAFWTNRDGGNNEIYTINPDGSEVTRVTDNAAHDQYPRWSPDGSRIAFQTFRDGNDEIYVRNPDRANPRRLTYHPGTDRLPDWGPSR